MPPRKPVSSLQNLTFAASSKLVLDMCQHIEDKVSWDTDLDLPFDTDEYKKAVATLRQHLRTFVAPFLWETFFNSVLELHRDEEDNSVDEITLYSVFVFEEARFDKLTLEYLPALCPRRVEFWVHCAAMLPNLIEADLSRVDCEQIVAAFCQSCTKLQVIKSFTMSDAQIDLLLENCKDLRSVAHRTSCTAQIQRMLEELVHLEHLKIRISTNILKSLNTNRTLKLRSLHLSLESSQDMQVVAERCPDLEHLEILGGSSGSRRCRKTLQTLTGSALKISKLRLVGVLIDLDVFDEFLATKGVHITELAACHCRLIGTPRNLLEMFSKCPKLVKFHACPINGLKPEHLTTFGVLHQISFPHLETLSIHVCNDPNIAISLTTKFIEHSQKISELKLGMTTDGQIEVPIDLEERLERLFSCPMTKTLTKLELSWDEGIMRISGHMIRHIVSSCPIMTSLSIPGRYSYVSHLNRCLKENNLDLNISNH